MTDAREKFRQATLALVGPGSIKQRLAGAFNTNLIDITAEELPEELQDEFCRLSEKMAEVPPIGDEGPVLATVRKMSRDEADRCAVRILSMYETLARSQMAI